MQHLLALSWFEQQAPAKILVNKAAALKKKMAKSTLAISLPKWSLEGLTPGKESKSKHAFSLLTQ